MEIIGITYKTAAGQVFHRHQPSQFIVRALSDDIQAVRLPNSYQDQKSRPGYFWMSRMQSMIAYESRLEMTILMQLDFNKAVSHVVSQPFVVHYRIEKRIYRHTPDFFVRYQNGATEVINVKPRQFLKTEKNLRAFSACRLTAHEMGCAYSNRCEMDPVWLENLRWLSGYRRVPAEFEAYERSLLALAKAPISIAEAIGAMPTLPAFSRPILFHMLWSGTLDVDLHKRLTDQSIIAVAAGGKTV